MCNRARQRGEPETLFTRFNALFPAEKPMDNRFNPVELYPKSRTYVVREEAGQRIADVMHWDVLGGMANFPMTNVRNLFLPQWRKLASDPTKRCLVPLTEFCEWAPKPTNLGDGKKPVRGEMWFDVVDQPIFAVAGFWQALGDAKHFAMVTCDPNELVAPIHPKAMITILHETDWDRWLQGSYEDAVDLQRPYPADQMRMRGPVFPTRTAA
ncbi:SOS response-associated peptidase family protein [Sphingobium phenoxybenzoativorans]|uniref:SOS response-associated peptidase family protein n=1 Tax=Sphingobium phenoxybenzoativorans TaxID=1592790 RepID=UPI0008726E9F|nr:SOS response-associated peptidase family protein [Sphingobium phenoxybenzoativorans]